MCVRVRVRESKGGREICRHERLSRALLQEGAAAPTCRANAYQAVFSSFSAARRACFVLLSRGKKKGHVVLEPPPPGGRETKPPRPAASPDLSGPAGSSRRPRPSPAGSLQRASAPGRAPTRPAAAPVCSRLVPACPGAPASDWLAEEGLAEEGAEIPGLGAMTSRENPRAPGLAPRAWSKLAQSRIGGRLRATGCVSSSSPGRGLREKAGGWRPALPFPPPGMMPSKTLRKPAAPAGTADRRGHRARLALPSPATSE